MCNSLCFSILLILVILVFLLPVFRVSGKSLIFAREILKQYDYEKEYPLSDGRFAAADGADGSNDLQRRYRNGLAERIGGQVRSGERNRGIVIRYVYGRAAFTGKVHAGALRKAERLEILEVGVYAHFEAHVHRKRVAGSELGVNYGFEAPHCSHTP